ncbi:MAG: RNA polymerase sigma factor [Propionibacteriaceae bacterium]|nr:RNA polymerase sigma factor [Propionibacteriaceae bacterium]
MAARGDRDAADRLVRLYYDEVFRFVRRQVCDDDTAWDLTQETLISMLRTIGFFDARLAGFRTWLLRIATNKIIDWHRSRARRPQVTLTLDDVEVVDTTDITVGAEQTQLTQRVESALSRYPTQAQQIFRLHVFGQRTFAEIGQELGTGDNTAKTTYYRLVGKLRKELADDFV